MKKLPKMEKLVTCASTGLLTTPKLARKLDELIATLPKTPEYQLRRKQGEVKDINQKERSEVSIITSAAMDRDGEIVLPDGIEFSDFLSYGTVLWGHEQQEPCGSCLWIKPKDNALIAKTVYPMKPANIEGLWLPDTIWGLTTCDPPILRGKSIGFVPVEMRDPTAEELAAYPDCQRVITRSWLVEYSVVSTPCNPQALIEGIGKGVDLSCYHWKTVGKVRTPKPKPINKAEAIKKAIAEYQPNVKRITEEAIEAYIARWGV